MLGALERDLTYGHRPARSRAATGARGRRAPAARSGQRPLHVSGTGRPRCGQGAWETGDLRRLWRRRAGRYVRAQRGPGRAAAIVRNAVAHGIEAGDAERSAAGKPAEGRVTLRVSQRGRLVSFACTDDGRGIDLDAVRRIAQRKGLGLENGRTMERDELLRLLLKGGISTSGTVTDVSGRGIGLDVVREAAERLGGEATVRTDAGKGTTIELVVPLSIASFHALVVEVVRRDRRDSAGRGARYLARDAGGDRANGAERVGPLRRTGDPAGVAAAGGLVGAVVRAAVDVFVGGHRARTDRRRRLHRRPDPGHRSTSSCVRFRSSRPPTAWSRAWRSTRWAIRNWSSIPTASWLRRSERAPSTVERRGSRLSHSRGRRLADHAHARAEHPGVGRLRRRPGHLGRRGAGQGARGARTPCSSSTSRCQAWTDSRSSSGSARIPHLRHIPSILVTSRNAPEDRQRGHDVGAQAYIVKSEFDQGVLLERIRTLVG